MSRFMKNHRGQVVLGLVLVMVIALGIGLSVVQKSLVDVSTSSKAENSSRAFSAAEAGVEQALAGSTSSSTGTLENNASAAITDTGLLPSVPSTGNQQVALEYPPLAKEEVAHFWLADPGSTPPAQFYKQNSLEVYWGDPVAERAAIEVRIVYLDSSTGDYNSKSFYMDSDTSRASGNGFVAPSASFPINNVTSLRCPPDGGAIDTTYGSNRNFACKAVVSLPSGLMVARTRLLYNSTSQPVALRAPVSCNLTQSGCFLPPQARIITSTGTSGQTQRKVQVFQIDKVVPPYFDYAIFSAGDISK